MRMIAYNIIKSITTPVILPNALFHSSFISVYQSFQTILLVVKNSGLHHRCELKRSSSIHQRRNIPARKQQQLYRSIQLQSTIVDQEFHIYIIPQYNLRSKAGLESEVATRTAHEGSNISLCAAKALDIFLGGLNCGSFVWEEFFYKYFLSLPKECGDDRRVSKV